MVREGFSSHPSSSVHRRNKTFVPQAIGPDDIANNYEQVYIKWCWSGHETANGLSKRFRIVSNRFARSPKKHGYLMHAIAQIVQFGIMPREMAPSFGCCFAALPNTSATISLQTHQRTYQAYHRSELSTVECWCPFSSADHAQGRIE